MKRIIKNFWPIILWALFVFVLSALPGNAFPHVPCFLDWLQPDKIVHFIFYGTFSFLLLYGIAKQYKCNKLRLSIKIIAFFFGTLFGLLLEILQYYVFIGRSGNFYDFAANMLGSAIGVLLFGYFERKKI